MRLLRKLQKLLGGYFILPHPVHESRRVVTTEVDCSTWLVWQQRTLGRRV